jgi:hypothetical protein
MNDQVDQTAIQPEGETIPEFLLRKEGKDVNTFVQTEEDTGTEAAEQEADKD